MSLPRPLIAGLALAAVVILIALSVVPGLRYKRTLSGYVEGEPLYLAAPVSGTVTSMRVARGDRVAQGQALFVVDPRQVEAQAQQAEAEAAAAQAQAQDARKGQRPVELAVYEANVRAAEARARDAGQVLRRIEPLAKKGVYAPARLDDARAAAEAAEAELAAARRQRDAAALGAREDQVRVADARAREAQAALAAAVARAGEVSPKAPSAGRIDEVFFQAGEWAPANQPILSILPNERIKLRIYVPETEVSAYRPGGVVQFTCDGCAKDLRARITSVSPRPEFTPPVIYSRDARDRLVYLVEALPGVLLNPGQPVDVTPLEPRR